MIEVNQQRDGEGDCGKCLPSQFSIARSRAFPLPGDSEPGGVCVTRNLFWRGQWSELEYAWAKVAVLHYHPQYH